MLVHAEDAGEGNLLAIYADDMEKVAGIGEWGTEGPAHYRAFLDWIAENQWIRTVKLSEWAVANEAGSRRNIEIGTFAELATEFDAGEGYENWYKAEDWAPYRGYFEWAAARVKELAARDADPALIELAEKQLLVSNWETAWHTPSTGPHGDPNCNGHASPWARALTSHSRHAAVTAEAAHWMRNHDAEAHAVCLDLDHDGKEETLLKNNQLFAVVSALHGGRIVSMFRVAGERAVMVVGNPCDDWNWMEDLNKYMDVPRNHPGAFSDVGFEHDRYDCERVVESGACAVLRLINVQEGSAARGLIKEFSLEAGSNALRVCYRLPESLKSLNTEIGLSPDYLGLLRHGSQALRTVARRGMRGFAYGRTEVWVKAKRGGGLRWKRPFQERFGHGCMLRLGAASREFEMELGASETAAAAATGNRVDRLETVR